MGFELDTQSFWDNSQLEAELKRVFDICSGCRRCYHLCPSFTDLFARLDKDSVDGEAEKLAAEDLRSVTDLCYQCKLCFNHCPYTPPHRWQVDFPRMMLRSKALQVKREGQSLQDRFLGRTDLIGRIGSYLAPLANWANRNFHSRRLMEKLLGIHQERLLPPYASETFRYWFLQRTMNHGSEVGKRVVLFYTCSVNFNEPEVGQACVKVLERNGIRVTCPEQRCCGMPFLDGGDMDATKNSARANVESLQAWVKEGYDIVVPGPTCSYMLKYEYPMLLKGDSVKKVAARTFDICEYLMALHREGRLDTRFVKEMGAVTYQMPCHLRAQNIGYKTRDLLELLPRARVHLVEKCAAIDGTWGLKRQYYDLSMKVAEPLLRELRDSGSDWTVSDCPMARLQIEQGMGKKPLHPVQLLQMAYGPDQESKR
ncbi:MAG: anaerobic glycerol-3-phosphate dehydrogenase subunit C [Candidatus Binatia bacterium]